MAKSWWVAAFVVPSLAALPSAARAACARTGEFVPTDAIHWELDHANRRITVTVNLAFYRADCPANYTCAPVAPATIAAITRAVEQYWSGQKYRCYDLVVVVNATSVANQGEVCDEAIDVALDHAPVNPRNSHVATEGARPSAEAWGSDDPDDRLKPAHSPDNPTRWRAFAAPGVYAHEFGHILGLHDNYDERNPKSGPIPGHAENLMTRSQGYVTQEMIDRVIRRSGNVNDDDVLCAWDVSSVGQLIYRAYPVDLEIVVISSMDIEGMRLIEAADGSIGGFGMMTLQGMETNRYSNDTCTGSFGEETLVHVSGTRVGAASGALLRMHFDPVQTLPIYWVTCPPGTGVGLPNNWGTFYGFEMEEFDLPAAGGVVTHTRSSPAEPDGTFDVSGTFTVVPVRE